ncbi:Aste57867_21283 [Aphanomyces stellatus]|uniref:Aste57867_21283 protein n=1 Tax=Aphanomyces stellatus TaxID=120398 RepID=A0A485LH64_9STRA|nr:hypothetical protein As57867_021214 [Aphanomyces stellatus]VFT97955.1 Aste57867_21283 [Aphanomyces stellatus]
MAVCGICMRTPPPDFAVAGIDVHCIAVSPESTFGFLFGDESPSAMYADEMEQGRPSSPAVYYYNQCPPTEATLDDVDVPAVDVLAQVHGDDDDEEDASSSDSEPPVVTHFHPMPTHATVHQDGYKHEQSLGRTLGQRKCGQPGLGRGGDRRLSFGAGDGANQSDGSVCPRLPSFPLRQNNCVWLPPRRRATN